MSWAGAAKTVLRAKSRNIDGAPLPLEDRLARIEDELTSHQRRDEALALLVRGLTNPDTLYETGARALALGLGYRWACVARIVDGGKRGQALAFWDGDRLADPFTYDLSTAPCGVTVSGADHCFYGDGVADRFPEDVALKDRGVAAYRGKSFLDRDGRVVGYVFAMNDRPEPEESELQRDFVALVAHWVGSEFARRATEDALRASEETYRTIFENAQVGLGRSTVNDGRITRANDRLAEIFGYTNSEELTDHLVMAERYVDPDVRGPMLAELKKTGQVRNVEAAVTRQDGEIIWIRYYARLRPGEDSFEFVVSDITEAHKAMESLRASEETYRSIFDNAQVGLGRSTLKEGKVVEANDRLAEIYGYATPDELMGDIVMSKRYVDPGVRGQLLEELEKHGELRNFEAAVTCNDGSVIWTRSFVRLRPGNDYFEFVVTDVTEEKHAVEAVKASERRFKQFAEVASDWLWESDTEHRYTFVSRPRSAKAEQSAADVLGKTRWEMVGGDPEKDELWRQHRADMDAHHSIRNFVYGYVSSEGKQIYRGINCDPAFDENGVFKGYRGVTTDLTELKRREHELAEQSGILQSVVDNIDQGISLVDADLVGRVSNKRFIELLDFPEEFAGGGTPFEDFIRYNAERGEYGPGDVEELVRERVELARQFQPHKFERTRADGRTIEVHGKPVPGGGMVTTYTDITDRKRHEEEIARHSALLGAALDAMVQGLIAFDVNLVILASNRQCRKILNVPAEMIAPGADYEALLRLFADRGDFGPGDPEEQAKKYIAIARGKEATRIERPGPDGTTLEVWFSPMAQGGAVITFADVTEAKRREAALAGQTALLGAIFETMDQGLITFDSDLTIVASNAVAAEMLEVDPEILAPGKTFEGLIRVGAERGDFGDLDPKEAFARLRALAGSKKSHRFERRIASGRVLETCGTPRPGGGFVVTYRDITGHKRAEERLEAANARLVRNSERLKASNAELEQFAYVASHDLQEPLRMVASYCQLLQKRYGGQLDDAADEFIGYAVDGANRMQKLISDLLAYSRVGTKGADLELVECSEIHQAALFNLQAAIEESGARITCDPLPKLLADRTQLTQLFQNLIGNAIKFESGKTPEIHVGAIRDGNSWIISVKDNGIGIEPQYAERIFLIFQRLHGAGQYSGTGIGLAVCKKIVERHGGKIWLESEPGQGTTFYFTLPAHGNNQ